MRKEKVPPHLRDVVDEFVNAKQAAREAQNSANRAKTQLRNAVKHYWADHNLPIGSFIRSHGLDIRYEAAESTVIDPAEVFQRYKDGKITEEQFLRMIKINKTEAKNVLGGDLVAELEKPVVGKTADIRIADAPIDEVDGEYIVVAVKENRRLRRKFGGGATAAKSTRKQRRRVRVKRG